MTTDPKDPRNKDLFNPKDTIEKKEQSSKHPRPESDNERRGSITARLRLPETALSSSRSTWRTALSVSGSNRDRAISNASVRIGQSPLQLHLQRQSSSSYGFSSSSDSSQSHDAQR